MGVWGRHHGGVGVPHPHDNFLEKWIKSLEITQSGVCRIVFRTWRLVSEGVVGEISCPCREDPLSPAVGRMVLSGWWYFYPLYRGSNMYARRKIKTFEFGRYIEVLTQFVISVFVI